MRRIVRRTVTTVTTITTTITWQETAADEPSDLAEAGEGSHDAESTAEPDSKQSDSFGQIVN